MAVTLAGAKARERTASALIDCDIHPALPSWGALDPYLSPRWRRHHETFGRRGPQGGYYPKIVPNAARIDSWPPGGAPPGSDLGFLRRQLLDAWNVECGILNMLGEAGRQLNLEYGAALARAMNDWQIAEWLDP